jgi:uncharacterized protein YheU (UPF0270 family)
MKAALLLLLLLLLLAPATMTHLLRSFVLRVACAQGTCEAYMEKHVGLLADSRIVNLKQSATILAWRFKCEACAAWLRAQGARTGTVGRGPLRGTRNIHALC